MDIMCLDDYDNVIVRVLCENGEIEIIIAYENSEHYIEFNGMENKKINLIELMKIIEEAKNKLGTDFYTMR